MDSMRHLSTSLPRTSRRRNEPDLLSSFKAAALSVTNLYKAAAAENTSARESGYQDALDDLLAFLDKESIGMDDGEGWRVRKWVLERLEDAPKAAGSDEEEEKQEEEETRCSSPEAPKKATLQPSTSDVSERRTSSEPPQSQIPQAPPVIAVPSLEDFSFRAATQYPTGHDRDSTMDLDNSPAVRSRPKPRGKKEGRSSTVSLTSTIGKRKFPYGDFFDIGNINFDPSDKRDNGRGGKRGRFV